MRSWSSKFLCILILPLLSLSLFVSCNGIGVSNKSMATVRDEAGRAISIKPLDDPRNPYKDQYGPWDRWLYENLEPVENSGAGDSVANTMEQLKHDISQPNTWTGLRGQVTAEGYLVPLTVVHKRFEDRCGAGTVEQSSTDERWVIAKGMMDPECYAAMHQSTDRISAAYYHTIPDWLIKNPPSSAMLLPNGDVITNGLLNDTSQPSSKDCCGGGGSSIFARYDLNGNLISTVKGRHWWYLYYEGKESNPPDGMMVASRDGFVEFTSPNQAEVLSRWDWNGKRLDLSQQVVHRDRHPFTFLSATQLRKYYEATHSEEATQL
jgi:hypothetical protein